MDMGPCILALAAYACLSAFHAKFDEVGKEDRVRVLDALVDEFSCSESVDYRG